MKIKIDSGPPYEAGVVYLRLTESDPGCIVVEAVYDYATCLPDSEAIYLPGGVLLTITSNGHIALSPNVDPDLGFPLDRTGRLTLDPYCESMTAKHARGSDQRPRLTEAK